MPTRSYCKLSLWAEFVAPRYYILVINIIGQFYSHAFVDITETWTRWNEPDAFWMRGDLNARKST